MNNALKQGFPPFLDEPSLRSAIESVCAKFGTVKQLKILPVGRESHGGGLNCLCLLKLDSAAAENALSSELKVFTFGSDLAFFADVDERWTGRIM